MMPSSPTLDVINYEGLKNVIFQVGKPRKLFFVDFNTSVKKKFFIGIITYSNHNFLRSHLKLFLMCSRTLNKKYQENIFLLCSVIIILTMR